MKKYYLLLLVGLLSVLLSGCDDYGKVMKSTDYAYKMERAKKYYNEREYYKALPLIEELISIYKGSQSIEELSYMYCYCFYGMGDYLTAAFHFQNFSRTFSRSEYTEDALYRNAYCYYLVSPTPNLDQSFTYKAIDAFQYYINQYPGSERLKECNHLIDQLRRKLELKAFRVAKLYFNLEKYKAASKYFQLVLKDFPDIEEKEEIYFLILRSDFLLASNSVLDKKKDRYQTAIEQYQKFIDTYPNSEYKKEAEKMYESCIRQLKT